MGSTAIRKFKFTQPNTAESALSLFLSHTHFKHTLKCSSEILLNSEYSNSTRENGLADESAGEGKANQNEIKVQQSPAEWNVNAYQVQFLKLINVDL